MILSPINPSDLIPIRGAYRHRIHLPAIPGYEGVGIIEGVGKSVSATLLGKRVLPLRGEGTWQQYVVTKAHHAVLVPDDIDDVTASQMYINPVTAWLVCTEELRLTSDDVLIVNACGSSIGRIFAQLSRVLGYRLVAVVRNSTHTEALTSLGAWAVIDTSKESLIDTVKGLTHGMGASAGIDSIGGEDGHQLIQGIRPGGTALSIGLLSGIQLNWGALRQVNPDVEVRPYWLRRWVTGVSDLRWHETFEDIFNLVRKRELSVHSSKEPFNLMDYKSALREAEQPGRTGKVLLSM